MRSVPKDTTLGASDIPADSTVLLLWGSANRDPAEFERPDEINLGRTTPRHHVAFGRGLHHCVGAPLARIEARIRVDGVARTHRQHHARLPARTPLGRQSDGPTPRTAPPCGSSLVETGPRLTRARNVVRRSPSDDRRGQ
jgi:cytochrome P450